MAEHSLDCTSKTADAFVKARRAVLIVMEDGKHWFHKPEQLQVPAARERENI